jgi:hypothetical protein
LENIKVELIIEKEKATKKIVKFFEIASSQPSPIGEKEQEQFSIEFGLQDWRSWKEAKAT